MPSETERSFSTVVNGEVDSKFQELKAGLVQECEKLAGERESKLREENDKLRKECEVLQKLVKAQPDQVVDTQSPQDSIVTTTAPVTSSLDKELNKLNACPEIMAVQTMGDLSLHDDFWSANAARPEHDHGFCQIGSFDEDHPTKVGHFWIIDPTGNLKLSWDVLGIPVLAWDLVTIPMQVFGIEDSRPMVLMGWVTLIFWTLDIPFCFTTGYFDKDGELIMEFDHIVKHYMKGMFSLDILIIGSDWLTVILENAGGGSAPPFLSNVALLRALRITRFARLMRLRKLKAKWQTVEDHIESEWVLVCVNLMSKVAFIIGVTHYVGCIFFWIGDQPVPGYDTWLDSPYHQYRRPDRTQVTFAEAPWAYQYWTSLHWSITQFTPGGMHIQPQNIPERAYTIFCLLFGMVVFSSFIASVTQARMQLNKLMSKFERDLWLLRKFCRQHKISHTLTVRMRRYVDLVLIPKFQHMSMKDVILLPQLSEHLREELQMELYSRKLAVHPFFQRLSTNKAAMLKMCVAAVANLPIARGDVIFTAGMMANVMYIITSGACDYIPHDKFHPQTRLLKNRWICEAALWTKWVTQGQLQGFTESSSVAVDAGKFRATLLANPLQMNVARHYAVGFLDTLNQNWLREGCVPSDLQEIETMLAAPVAGSSFPSSPPTPTSGPTLNSHAVDPVSDRKLGNNANNHCQGADVPYKPDVRHL